MTFNLLLIYYIISIFVFLYFIINVRGMLDWLNKAPNPKIISIFISFSLWPYFLWKYFFEK